MWISLNVGAVTYASYAWYKYTMQRKMSFDEAHKEYLLEIENDSIFGIRKAGSVFHLIVKAYPEHKFKLTEEQVNALIGKCVGWSGKVKGVAVSAGLGGKDKKVKPAVTQTQIKIPRTSNTKGENKALTDRLRKLRIKGIDSIVFLHKESFLPGEVTYYYDIQSVYDAYADSRRFEQMPKTWGDYIEAMIEKSASDLDVECGTVNYLGKPTKLMSVLDLEP